MPEELPKGQYGSLCRRVHGGIGRVLQRMKRIEKTPERVRRIRQAAVRKSVRCEQVAVLVMNCGRTCRKDGQETYADEYWHKESGGNRQLLASRSALKCSF